MNLVKEKTQQQRLKNEIRELFSTLDQEEKKMVLQLACQLVHREEMEICGKEIRIFSS